MSMNNTFLNALADHGGGLITHIGLVDDLGAELASAAYARQAVTWTAAADGLIRPTADLVFDTTAGDTVAGWVGYSALTTGTAYGGAALTQVDYSNDGTYTLLAASTAIDLDPA